MLYNRWSAQGIFAQMMAGLAAEHGDKKTVMSDATYLKDTSRRVQPGREKMGCGRLVGRTKGGKTTKLHAICDSQGCPINFIASAGQVSDDIGTRALLSRMPHVDWLLGDRGYDADWVRHGVPPSGGPV